MGKIVDGYDLSGGNKLSDEVASPNNWRVTATTTGCPALQYVRIDFEVEDSLGNWAVMTDDNDRPIQMTLRGNETKSRNPIVVNAANSRVVVRPPKESPSVTINVDSNNA